ncbi:hypothetical protein EVAR_78514_1 [Eumeta japonica]|uniref:Secreted protein n=1 Tax=Eumeta variegata TaxID=151549 RepID=A0A4C1TZ04_EUMVA|nr:hypothetical protein EVAR_78514_1 [Eumeta japonica]
MYHLFGFLHLVAVMMSFRKLQAFDVVDEIVTTLVAAPAPIVSLSYSSRDRFVNTYRTAARGGRPMFGRAIRLCSSGESERRASLRRRVIIAARDRAGAAPATAGRRFDLRVRFDIASMRGDLHSDVTLTILTCHDLCIIMSARWSDPRVVQ